MWGPGDDRPVLPHAGLEGPGLVLLHDEFLHGALLLLTMAGMGNLSGGLTTLPLGQQGRSLSGSHYPKGSSPASRYRPTLGKDFGIHPNNLRTAFETSTLSPSIMYTINLGLTTSLVLWFFPIPGR